MMHPALQPRTGKATSVRSGTLTAVPASARAPRKLATIDITNLRLRTFIGFNEEERVKQQDVVINISIRYRLSDAVMADEVDAALDYKTITKRVIAHVEDGRFLLLEKLTGDVLDICTEHDDVEHARVTIEKPHALRFADSVSITLEHLATHNTNATENLR